MPSNLRARARQLESAEFAAFLAEHSHWLKPYALFCVVRDTYGTSDTAQWGDMARISYAHIDALASPGGAKFQACRYWYYLQFLLHQQLLDASLYGRSRGVCLMGVLPIGIHRQTTSLRFANLI
jgi:4-alpha-glucanotransferase